MRFTDTIFQNTASYGENQDVFFYQVYVEAERPPFLMRATFYGRAVVSLAFTLKPMGPG